MAFVTPIPEEQQNQLGPSGTTTPNPLSVLPPQAPTGGGSSGQGGGGAAGAPGVGTPTQFGTGASRLSDYLKANQDQVQQMANQVSGQIGQQYNTAKSGVDQAVQNFGQTVSNSYTPNDPTLIAQVQSDPRSVAADANKTASFKSMLNNQYTGPTSFEGSSDFQGAQKGVSEAVDRANLVNTYPGLSTYLQNYVEQNATPGQNTLDTVLLQSSLPAYQSIQAAAKPFAGLTDYLNSATGGANQLVQNAQAEAPQTRQAAQAAIDNAVKSFQDPLNARLSAAEKDREQFNARYQDIMGKIGSNLQTPLTQQDLDAMGLSDAANGYIEKYNMFNQDLLGVNGQPISLGNWAYGGAAANNLPTLGGVATADDYATEAALQALSGNDYGLGDTPDTPYVMGGKMPTIDYMGAFNQAGQALKDADTAYVSNPGGESAKYQAAFGRLHDPAFYTSPSENTPAPSGDPYPYPTSPQPGPTYVWNPTFGIWQDLGNGGGGGGNTFSRPIGV